MDLQLTNQIIQYLPITSLDRPGLLDFLAYIEKHGKAWVRGYSYNYIHSKRSLFKVRSLMFLVRPTFEAGAHVVS